MKPLAQCQLYTFVDAAYLRDRKVADVARQLCDGGSDLIQLRAKNLPLETVQRMAEEVQPVTERARVGLVINDFPEVARHVGAPFCHLGQEDFFEAGHTHVSQILGGDPRMEFGLSTHTPDQAERALRAQPGYIAIGPIFATATKPGAAPVTLEYVRWAAAHVAIPWFAIGGVHLGNLDEVVAAGAARICVVSAILNAPDIAKACRQFKQRLPSALPMQPLIRN